MTISNWNEIRQLDSCECFTIFIIRKSKRKKKYKNVAWFGDNTQSKIRSAEDWKVVWDEPTKTRYQLYSHLKK